eukprot:scaffold41256_cov145-Amphora_coffeaeformis.AAC.4
MMQGLEGMSMMLRLLLLLSNLNLGHGACCLMVSDKSVIVMSVSFGLSPACERVCVRLLLCAFRTKRICRDLSSSSQPHNTTIRYVSWVGLLLESCNNHNVMNGSKVDMQGRRIIETVSPSAPLGREPPIGRA